METPVSWRPMVGLKRLSRMLFRRNPLRFFIQPRSSFDFASQVGDGTGSSTVMACLLWIARTFPEAPPALYRQLASGEEEQERDHPMLRLLARPNEYYSGPILEMASIVDWNVDGNAYWIKLRRGTGLPAELWWAPSWTMEPKGDEHTFITHYEYRVGTRTLKIDPSDVVHFRFGMDADDPRKGYSPLKSVLREVFTDDEAANFTASLLRNMGVPGLMISPKGDRMPSEEDVLAVKAYVSSMFGGDKRGEPLVMSGATEIEQFGFSPEELQLRDLRRIPEERVSAVLGVPAVVAGLGAGLDRSTFTNMAEAREMAYESNVIPSQRIIGEDIRWQLLPDFEPDPFAWRVGRDLTKVRVLQEDEDKRVRRLDVAYRGGMVTRAEVRRELGRPVDEALDNVYLRSLNMVEVPTDGSEPRGMAANGNGNGAGGPDAAALAKEIARELERSRA